MIATRAQFLLDRANGTTDTVAVVPACTNAIVPLALTANRRWVYRTPDGRRTFAAYAPNALWALELIEAANLGVPIDPAGLHAESEKEGRAWEEGVSKSIEYGTKK